MNITGRPEITESEELELEHFDIDDLTAIAEDLEDIIIDISQQLQVMAKNYISMIWWWFK